MPEAYFTAKNKNVKEALDDRNYRRRNDSSYDSAYSGR